MTTIRALAVVLAAALSAGCAAGALSPCVPETASPTAVFPGSFVEVRCAANTTLPTKEYASVRAAIGGVEAAVLATLSDRVVLRVPPAAPVHLSPVELRFYNSAAAFAGQPVGRVAADLNLSWAGTIADGAPRGPPLTLTGSPLLASSANADANADADAISGKRAIQPGTQTQRLLVIHAYATDRAPGSAWWNQRAAPEATELQRQIDVHEELVLPLMRQMSWGKMDVQTDYTDWLALPEDDNHYFWRDEDVNPMAPPDEIAEVESKLRTPERQGDLFYDACEAAIGAGFDMTNYDGITLVLGVDNWRGRNIGSPDAITEDRSGGRSITLKADTSMWAQSFDAHIGRRMHEMAHAIARRPNGGKTDIYGYPMSARRFDMMGYHNRKPQFTAFNLVETVGWVAEHNIARRDRAVDFPLDETFTVVAHGLTEDPDNTDVSVVRLQAGEVIFYIEARELASGLPDYMVMDDDCKPPTLDLDCYDDMLTWAGANQPLPRIFDVLLGTSNSSITAGVLVTVALPGLTGTETAELTNEDRPSVTMLGPSERLLNPGEVIADPANDLRITVEQQLTPSAAGEARFRVRVEWKKQVDDPSGLFDLAIAPIDGNHQSDDVAVDSPANGYGTFETNPTDGLPFPTERGDRPQVDGDDPNRVLAQATNDGTVVDVTNVQATLYSAWPPTLSEGDDTWFPAQSLWFNMAANSTQKLVPDADAFTFDPLVGEHTCLRVQISAQPGERVTGNNIAQENVFDFDVPGASPHRPVFMDIQLGNPRQVRSRVWVRLDALSLPAGWDATVENAWFTLDGGEVTHTRIALVSNIGRIPAEAVVATSPARQGRLPARDAQTGSCCLSGVNASCTDGVSRLDCFAAQNGTASEAAWSWRPTATCAAVPCGMGACCDGSATQPCEITNASSCPAPRRWAPGQTCAEAACSSAPDVGACCVPPPSSSAPGFCTDVRADGCPLGASFTLGVSCSASTCVEGFGGVHAEAQVRAWDNLVAPVELNTDFAEHLADLGGVTISGRAATRVSVSPTRSSVVDDGAGGANATLCVDVPEGRPAAAGLTGVAVLIRGCPPPNNRLILPALDATGCASAPIPSVCLPAAGSTACPEFFFSLAGLPRGSGVAPDTSSNAALALEPAGSICCTPRAGAPPLCSGDPSRACRYDAETGACRTSTCPNDPSQSCVLQYARDAARTPFCTCGNATSSRAPRCVYDESTGACDTNVCPFDSGRTCELLTDPLHGRPVCGCSARQPVPTCAYNPSTGRCTSQVCDSDSTKRCVGPIPPADPTAGMPTCTCADAGVLLPAPPGCVYYAANDTCSSDLLPSLAASPGADAGELRRCRRIEAQPGDAGHSTPDCRPAAPLLIGTESLTLSSPRSPRVAVLASALVNTTELNARSGVLPLAAALRGSGFATHIRIRAAVAVGEDIPTTRATNDTLFLDGGAGSSVPPVVNRSAFGSANYNNLTAIDVAVEAPGAAVIAATPPYSDHTLIWFQITTNEAAATTVELAFRESLGGSGGGSTNSTTTGGSSTPPPPPSPPSTATPASPPTTVSAAPLASSVSTAAVLLLAVVVSAMLW